MIDNNTLSRIKTDKSFREYYIKGLLMGLQSGNKPLEQVYNELMQIVDSGKSNPYDDFMSDILGKR